MTYRLEKDAIRLVALVLLVLWSPASGALSAELVMFETAACPWCDAWNREVGVVYPRTETGKRAPLRRVDRDGPRPPDIEHLESIVYTPTFVLLADGQEVGRILGYPGDNHIWGLLDMMLDKLPPSAR